MRTMTDWLQRRWQKFRDEHELGWEFRVVAVCAVVFVVAVLLEFVVVNEFTELVILISGVPLLVATLGKIITDLKPRRSDGGGPFRSPRQRMADELTRSAHPTDKRGGQPATKPTRR